MTHRGSSQEDKMTAVCMDLQLYYSVFDRQEQRRVCPTASNVTNTCDVNVDYHHGNHWNRCWNTANKTFSMWNRLLTTLRIHSHARWMSKVCCQRPEKLVRCDWTIEAWASYVSRVNKKKKKKKVLGSLLWIFTLRAVSDCKLTEFFWLAQAVKTYFII